MLFFKQKDLFADKTKCEECKHWVDKSDCQEVVLKDDKIVICNDGLGWEHEWGWRYDDKIIYFCPEHKKPYEIIIGNRYYKNIPAHQIEVDIKGKEIKK